MKSLKISLVLLSLMFVSGTFAQDLSHAKKMNSTVKPAPTQKEGREKIKEKNKKNNTKEAVEPKKQFTTK